MRALLPPVLAAMVAGCAAEPRQTLREPPAMTVIGEPVGCVETNRIRETRVHDDQTIDFVMSDGAILRNTLPTRCPGLGFARAFAYSTSISRLCNVDIITVVEQGGGPRRGASCGLGMFVPVEPAK